MYTTFKIHTNWDYNPKKLEYIEALEEAAKDRAFEMIKEGYTSGELYLDINNRECRGWWSLNTINE